jgi:hypothetical protein
MTDESHPPAADLPAELLVGLPIDPDLLPFLDQAEFSLRDAEHHARSIYLAFSRIHPEEITPQTIESFHDLIEQWYRSHRGWIGLCRQQCREVEAIVDFAKSRLATESVTESAPVAESALPRIQKTTESVFAVALLVFCSLFIISFGLIVVALAFRFSFHLMSSLPT